MTSGAKKWSRRDSKSPLPKVAYPSLTRSTFACPMGRPSPRRHPSGGALAPPAKVRAACGSTQFWRPVLPRRCEVQPGPDRGGGSVAGSVRAGELTPLGQGGLAHLGRHRVAAQLVDPDKCDPGEYQRSACKLDG